MARDVALQAYSRESGECVFSIYSWLNPTLSLGRNQAAKGLYDRARIHSQKIDIVRRPTGGRAILHDHEITYSVTGPDCFAETLPDAYQRINELLLAGLRILGVPVEIAQPEKRAPVPGISPCFAEPVLGEITAHGKKLVGSAQFREKGAFLQHGSILVENDQDRLGLLALEQVARQDSSPATLRDLLGRVVTPHVMADAMFTAVKTIQDPQATMMEEEEIRATALLLRDKFVDPLWTWRR